MKRRILTGLVCACLGQCLHGAVIYVNQAATGGNSGGSWNNAYTSLQAALGQGTSGDEVWVAAGTYSPAPGTDRSSTFSIPSGVALYGGFAGTELSLDERNPSVNATVLTGDIGTPHSRADNCYHVVTGASGAILDGVTVRGGYADGSEDAGRGAGVFVDGGQMTVAGCRLEFNAAVEDGGAIYARNAGLTVEGTTFANNSSERRGGAVRVEGGTATVSQCQFEDNVSFTRGGGLSVVFANLSLTDTSFRDNSSDDGGALDTDGTSSYITVSRCSFSDNTATGSGGAAFVLGWSAAFLDTTFEENHGEHGGGLWAGQTQLTVSGCTFKHNRAAGDGGGVCASRTRVDIRGTTFRDNESFASGAGVAISSGSGTITNSLFAENEALAGRGGGAALLNDDHNESQPVNITSCTFAENTADTGGAGLYINKTSPEVTNCIFWNVEKPDRLQVYNGRDTYPRISYCCLRDDTSDYGDIGFVKENPRLTQDFSLSPDSPCIDAGSTAALGVSPGQDVTGGARVRGNAVDIGAVEAAEGAAPVSPTGYAVGPRPEFQWTTLPDVAWYQIWINVNGGLYYENWLSGVSFWTPTVDFPAGSYSWWVRSWRDGVFGAWSSALNFRLGAPEPNAPSGTVTASLRPTFSWAAVSGASQYRVWLAGPDPDGQPIIATPSGTFWQPETDLPTGNHTWWVQPWNGATGGTWSNATAFDLRAEKPGATRPIWPIDSVTTTSPAFEWVAVSGATWYRLELKKDGKDFVDQWIEGNTTWTYPEGALEANQYEWRVQTWNVHGYGPWSEKATVYTGAPRGVAPVVRGAIRPTFRWTPVAGATRYEIRVDKDGTEYLREQVEGVTEWECDRDFDPGSYVWGVLAQADGRADVPSRWLSFRVDLPIAISPAGVVSTTRSPLFAWQPTEEEDDYDLLIEKNDRSYHYEEDYKGTSWQSTWDFADGVYTWQVRPSGDRAAGWSSVVDFSIQGGVPAPTTAPLPAYRLSAGRPTLTWNPVVGGTKYRIWLERSNEHVVADEWVEGMTSWQPSHDLNDEFHQFWIQPASETWQGHWVMGAVFRIDKDFGQPTINASTSIATDDYPRISWSVVDQATKYRLWIDHNGVKYHETWIDRETEWRPHWSLPTGSYDVWIQAWIGDDVPDGPDSCSEKLTFTRP